MTVRTVSLPGQANQFALPSSWILTTLGEVTQPRGIRMKPSEMPNAPFIGLENLEAHTMKLVETGKTSDVKSSASYFASGDVLYGRLRPYLNKVYRPDFEGLASAEFIIFPHQKYLAHVKDKCIVVNSG